MRSHPLNSISPALSIIYVFNRLRPQSTSIKSSSFAPLPTKNHNKMLGCILLILSLIRMDQRREQRRAQEAQAAQNNPVAPVAQYQGAPGAPGAPVTQIAPQSYDPPKEPQTYVVSA